MNKKLFLDSVYSGLFVYIICLYLRTVEAFSALLMFIYFFPGCTFGFILIARERKNSNFARWVFVLLCGVLHISALSIVTGETKFGISGQLCFFIGSIFGAIGLVILYHLLIRRFKNFIFVLVVGVLIGSISSVLPTINYNYADVSGSEDRYRILESALLFSAFPVWQVLVGFLISQCQLFSSY